MTRSYSLDLRVRVIAFVEGGHSRRAAARHFGVSDSFAIKLLHRQTQLGSPAPARQGRPRGVDNDTSVLDVGMDLSSSRSVGRSRSLSRPGESTRWPPLGVAGLLL